MVGGLVKQEQVRMLDESFGDGEALFPAARVCGSFSVESSETSDAERGAQSLLPVGLGHACAAERGFDDAADGSAGGELGILLDVSHAQVFARRDFTRIGLDFAVEHLEQRGLAASVGGR